MIDTVFIFLQGSVDAKASDLQFDGLLLYSQTDDTKVSISRHNKLCAIAFKLLSLSLPRLIEIGACHIRNVLRVHAWVPHLFYLCMNDTMHPIGRAVRTPKAMTDVDALLCACIARTREVQLTTRLREERLRQEMSAVSEQRHAFEELTGASTATVRKLEAEVVMQRTKINELLATGAKMEALLRDAVTENQRLLATVERHQRLHNDERSVATAVAAATLVQSTEGGASTPTVAASEGASRDHGNDVGRLVSDAPTPEWSFDTDPDALSFVRTLATTHVGGASSLGHDNDDSRQRSDMWRHSAAVFLLAVAAAVRLKAQPEHDGNAQALCMVDGASGCLRWQRCHWPTAGRCQQRHSPSFESLGQPECLDQQGKQVWWPHAAWREYENLLLHIDEAAEGTSPTDTNTADAKKKHPQGALGSGRATPADVLMWWHPSVLVVDSGIVALASTALYSHLVAWHNVLAECGAPTGTGEASGVTTTVLLLEAVEPLACVLVTSSVMLGSQQMLYVVHCNDGAADNAAAVHDAGRSKRTIAAQGRWLTVDGVVRMMTGGAAVDSCPNDALDDTSDRVLSFSLVSNVAAASGCDSTHGYARVTFPATYSLATGSIQTTVACNWDAWPTRDFGPAVVQLAGDGSQQGDDGDDGVATPPPLCHAASSAQHRRSVAFLVPRESNTFAFHCASWICQSPARRRSGGRNATAVVEDCTTVPCSVTCYLRRCGPRSPHMDSIDANPVRSIRLVASSTAQNAMPVEPGECRGRRRRRCVLAQIDGRDVCLDEGTWFPLDPMGFGVDEADDDCHPPSLVVAAPKTSALALHEPLPAASAMVPTPNDGARYLLANLSAWCTEVLAAAIMAGVDAHNDAFHAAAASTTKMHGGALCDADGGRPIDAPPPAGLEYPLRQRLQSLEEQLTTSQQQCTAMRASHDCMSSAADAYRRRVGELEVELEETLGSLHSLKCAHRRIVERAAQLHNATSDE